MSKPENYKSEELVPAKYVTIWDDETEIRTDCKLDLVNARVYDIETVDVDGVDTLTDEYVEYYSGAEQDWVRINQGDFINADNE